MESTSDAQSTDVLVWRDGAARWSEPRTHTEEFYEVAASSLHVPALNRELRQWERAYNTVRPHRALRHLTPQQFLLRRESQRENHKCH